jgi:hypothetical protein
MTETQTPQPRRASRPLRRRGGRERPPSDPIATPAPQSPLDFTLAFMRDESKPDALRVSDAKAALPYLHTRGEEQDAEPEPEREPMSDLELARRIAHILTRGKEQAERDKVHLAPTPPGARSLSSGRASRGPVGAPPSPEGEGEQQSQIRPEPALPVWPDDERAQRNDPFDPHPGYRWIP